MERYQWFYYVRRNWNGVAVATQGLKPEFSSSNLSKYLEIISQACEQVIETLKQVAPPKEVEVDPLFVELTMRVISSLVLGIPVDRNSTSQEGPPLEVSNVYEAMSIVGYRFLRQARGEKTGMKDMPH